MPHESPRILAPVRAAANGVPTSSPTPGTQSSAEIAQAAPEREIMPRCAHEGCACPAEPNSEWCSEACRDAQQGYSAAPICPCGHDGCVTKQEEGTRTEPGEAA